MTQNVACRLFKEQIQLINQLPEKERPLVLYLAINHCFNQFDFQNDNQIENQNENAYVSVSVSESLSDISKCVLELLKKNIVCKEFSNNYGGKRVNSGRPKSSKGMQLDTNSISNGIQEVSNSKDKDKDNSLILVNSNIREAMEKWLAYKKEKKQKYTAIGLKQCFEKLKEMSNDNPIVAMKIVDESISNNWSGLFPLKKTTQQTKSERINQQNLEFLKKSWGV